MRAAVQEKAKRLICLELNNAIEVSTSCLLWFAGAQLHNTREAFRHCTYCATNKKTVKSKILKQFNWSKRQLVEVEMHWRDARRVGWVCGSAGWRRLGHRQPRPGSLQPAPPVSQARSASPSWSLTAGRTAATVGCSLLRSEPQEGCAHM